MLTIDGAQKSGSGTIVRYAVAVAALLGQPLRVVNARARRPQHHVRKGLHRRRGYTTQPIERSHVPTRDRLRGTRGLRTISSGQQFLESFEAFHALRRGMVKLRALVPTYQPTQATEHEKVRVVIAAMAALETQRR